MQKVTDEDLIKQCNAAIGAEPSMYNQNIIPHLHRYFITGYRVCEQDATLSPPDAGKDESENDLDKWPLIKMKDGRWFYCYKDLRGYNQHSGIFSDYEGAFSDYTKLCSTKEFSDEHIKAIGRLDAGKEQEAVAFAEWAATSYTFLPDTKVWYESGVGVSYKSHFFTTSELYTLYKQNK